MFALGPVEILAGVLIAVLLEVVLFWAAAALGNAPDLKWGKIAFVSLIASVVCGGVCGVIAWSLRSFPLTAPENRLLLLVVALLGLLVSWVIPGVLYAPLVPVSLPRGMLISVVQVLLRLFLYVLLLAAAMVVLAIVQIVRGPEPRSEVLVPLVQAVLLLVP
jgi:hypothetical protein